MVNGDTLRSTARSQDHADKHEVKMGLPPLKRRPWVSLSCTVVEPAASAWSWRVLLPPIGTTFYFGYWFKHGLEIGGTMNANLVFPLAGSIAMSTMSPAVLHGRGLMGHSLTWPDNGLGM